MTVDPNIITMATPTFTTDQIIGIFEGSTTSAAPAAFSQNYTETPIAHSFGDTVETQLIYNTGSGWNDQDMSITRISSGRPVFQTLDVIAYSTKSDIVVASTNFYDNIASAGYAYNIDYKVFILAKKNQNAITPIPTKQRIQYRSSDNYLKIADSDVLPMSVPSGTSQYTIFHTITGNVPRVRASIEYTSSGQLWPASPNQYSNSSFVNNNPITTTISQNATSVTFNFANSTASPIEINLHYRVYYDS